MVRRSSGFGTEFGEALGEGLADPRDDAAVVGTGRLRAFERGVLLTQGATCHPLLQPPLSPGKRGGWALSCGTSVRSRAQPLGALDIAQCGFAVLGAALGFGCDFILPRAKIQAGACMG